MSRKHARTLATLFSHPTSTGLAWRDVVALVVSLGGETQERAGSRVFFLLNGAPTLLHRPHPGKELDPAAVRQMRKFLTDAGVKP